MKVELIKYTDRIWMDNREFLTTLFEDEYVGYYLDEFSGLAQSVVADSEQVVSFINVNEVFRLCILTIISSPLIYFRPIRGLRQKFPLRTFVRYRAELSLKRKQNKEAFQLAYQAIRRSGI